MAKKYDSNIVGWYTRGGKRIPIRSADQWKSKLIDDDDFETYVHKNLDNPDFFNYGKEHGTNAVMEMWWKNKHKRATKDAHEVDVEEAVDTIRNGIKHSWMEGWFRGADSSYKPNLMTAILNDPNVLNAGWNIAYYNYCISHSDDPMPFSKWLRTKQTMYRGESHELIEDDHFISFTPNEEVAKKFGKVRKIEIRPIDTLGSYQTTGEEEYLVFR